MRRPRPARGGRAAPASALPVIVLAAAAAVGAACTDIPTDPTTPVAIEVAPLPFPSVVAGDTLRDTLGAVAPLRLRVFNGKGGEIPDAPVRFYALDTALVIDSITGVVYAPLLLDTPGRFVASVGNLQTLPQTLDITIAPDTLLPDTTTAIHVLRLPDTPANAETNTIAFTATAMHHAAVDTLRPVKSYIVRFRILDEATGVADSVSIVDEQGRASVIDTTDANGVASRSVRVHPAAGAAQLDSVIVLATLRYRDQAPDSAQIIVRVQR